MQTLKFLIVAFALLGLVGCQAAGTGASSYAGAIGDLESRQSRATVKTVRKRTTRRVVKRRKTVRKAYAAKRTKRRTKRVTKAIAKVTKRSRRKSARKAGGKSNKNIDKLIAKHAKANGVPVNLARAVVQIESAGRVNARGAAGEIGLMQLRPRTARGIGYKGKMKNLYNPDTNLAYGMKYLGEAYRRGGKTPCGAVLKYNAGHYAKRWNPVSRKYCKRVKTILKKG